MKEVGPLFKRAVTRLNLITKSHSYALMARMAWLITMGLKLFADLFAVDSDDVIENLLLDVSWDIYQGNLTDHAHIFDR